jgi:hypothetical protein
VQKDENNKFSDACHDKGADKPTIAGASKRVNDRIFPVTPDGPLDKWAETDQKNQAIAKRRATQRLEESDPQTSRDIINAAGDGAAQARREVNQYGTDSMWDWLLGKRGEKPPTEEPDDSDDSGPLIETRMDQIRRIEADKKSLDTEPDAEPDEKPFKFFIFF